MPRYQILIEHPSRLSVPELFAALADHNGMAKIFGAPVKRITDGQGDVNGVGSVRQIGPPGPLAVHETVQVFEPGKRIDYRVTRGGFPMKNHQGQMRFNPTPTGSVLRWQIDFDMPPVIGGVVRQVLQGALRKGLRKLG